MVIKMYSQGRQSRLKSTSATSRPQSLFFGYNYFKANFYSIALRRGKKTTSAMAQWHWLVLRPWYGLQQSNKLLFVALFNLLFSANKWWAKNNKTNFLNYQIFAILEDFFKVAYCYMLISLRKMAKSWEKYKGWYRNLFQP